MCHVHPKETFSQTDEKLTFALILAYSGPYMAQNMTPWEAHILHMS